MEFFIKDKWVAAKKGDKLAVPKGIKHAFSNPSQRIVTVFNTHQPALKKNGKSFRRCLQSAEQAYRQLKKGL